MATDFRIKRIYDLPSAVDGYRMLVDRLWPRGVTKADARIDRWAKELAPSTELRKWFHEDATRHGEFATRYAAELEDRRDEIDQLLKTIDNPTITLLTATKEPAAGHVPILEGFLRRS
ncbi:MAG: DUF488 family protein [Planctomycetia bacterium]|nr:DUF488 family protein [Planctomycetia bacterium]